jgi:hypothetical protein
MTTRAPNEQNPRQPDGPGARNDYGIDPEGVLPPEVNGDQAADQVKGEDVSTAEGNAFSPDFEPEADEQALTKPKDTDIETDGG